MNMPRINSPFTTHLGRPSPPSLSGKSKGQATEASENAQDSVELARVKPNRRSLSKTALAVGTLAAASLSFLAGCASGGPPPVETPGPYNMEEAELVLMNKSVDRFRIHRPLNQYCNSGSTSRATDDQGNSYTITERDCGSYYSSYHSLGVHVGHGVVVDLNGNVFASPQLVVSNGVTGAVDNPDLIRVVTRDGEFEMETSNLVQTSPGNFQTSGRWGNHDIRISSSGVILDGEEIVTSEGPYQMTISEDFDEARLRSDIRLQSQGDHFYGRYRDREFRISYDDDIYTFNADRSDRYGDFSYNAETLVSETGNIGYRIETVRESNRETKRSLSTLNGRRTDEGDLVVDGNKLIRNEDGTEGSWGRIHWRGGKPHY